MLFDWLKDPEGQVVEFEPLATVADIRAAVDEVAALIKDNVTVLQVVEAKARWVSGILGKSLPAGFDVEVTLTARRALEAWETIVNYGCGLGEADAGPLPR